MKLYVWLNSFYPSIFRKKALDSLEKCVNSRSKTKQHGKNVEMVWPE